MRWDICQFDSQYDRSVVVSSSFFLIPVHVDDHDDDPALLVNHFISDILWRLSDPSSSLVIHKPKILKMKVYMPWWPKMMTIRQCLEVYFMISYFMLLFHCRLWVILTTRVIWQQKWWAYESWTLCLWFLFYTWHINVKNEGRSFFSFCSLQSSSLPRFHTEIHTEIMQ